jgi:hypothetical protein
MAAGICPDDYGVSPDAIPPMLSGAGQEAVALLELAREVPRIGRRFRLSQEVRRNALAHVRRAWIGFCCGNQALLELEFERVWDELLHNPLGAVSMEKLAADQRRGIKQRANSLSETDIDRRNAAIRASTEATATLAQVWGLSEGRVRAIRSEITE